jgi:hypothetical protein
MGSGSDITCAGSSTGKDKLTPFAQVMVTLSKEEEIRLRAEANYWKGQHRQALARLAQREADHRLAMTQAVEREEALRSELAKAAGEIRDLRKRLFGRKSERRSDTAKNPASDDQKSAKPRVTEGRLQATCRHRLKPSNSTPPIARTAALATPTFPARRTVKSSRLTSRRTGG